MSSKHKTVLCRHDENETEVSITYSYLRGHGDYYDSYYGWTPGTPPEVEILSATVDGVNVNLSDAETDAFTQHIIENHDDCRDCDDYRDRRRDDIMTGAAS